MSAEIRDSFLALFDEEGRHALAGQARALSDEEIASVAGGVGGAGEGTCWYCGKPAVWNGSVWFCKDCHKGVSLDDAETIKLYKSVELQFGRDYILTHGSYPVWWDQVVT